MSRQLFEQVSLRLLMNRGANETYPTINNRFGIRATKACQVRACLSECEGSRVEIYLRSSRRSSNLWLWFKAVRGKTFLSDLSRLIPRSRRKFV